VKKETESKYKDRVNNGSLQHNFGVRKNAKNLIAQVLGTLVFEVHIGIEPISPEDSRIRIRRADL
jgi:hypothetical protein